MHGVAVFLAVFVYCALSSACAPPYLFVLACFSSCMFSLVLFVLFPSVPFLYLLVCLCGRPLFIYKLYLIVAGSVPVHVERQMYIAEGPPARTRPLHPPLCPPPCSKCAGPSRHLPYELPKQLSIIVIFVWVGHARPTPSTNFYCIPAISTGKLYLVPVF